MTARKTPLKKITVAAASAEYPVLIGVDCLDRLAEQLRKAKLPGNIFLVIDSNVNTLHGKRIRRVLQEAARKFGEFVYPAGERYKTQKTVSRIHEALIEQGFGRDTVVVAVGGGVTGDAAGYAASTFTRGVQLIHVPTTLLAMVDSAIGGKTGINLSKRKNIVGTFYQPGLVFTDLAFLETLPEGEFASGMGEAVKYAFLGDNELFRSLNKKMQDYFARDMKLTKKLVAACAQMKADVVMADEKEGSLRKILNLGHTFAHAFESDLNYRVKHGEAVVAGIVAALVLSRRKGFLTHDQFERFAAMPLQMNLPAALRKIDLANVYNVMGSDKKNRDGAIKFVLTAGIGQTLLDVEASEDEALASLHEMVELLGS